MSVQVPKGYKQTEVGVIPEDWEVASLQDICAFKITYGIVQCGPHIENGVPYIRVSDMENRELSIESMLRTSHEIAKSFSRSRVDLNDIVYALRGKIGEVRKVNKDVVGANLTQGTARISLKKEFDSEYILWALRSSNSEEQANSESKGSTFKEITLEKLRRIQVSIPSANEQKTIAEALSDTDALIESLEQLIAKKRQIKQGAMQELLTGQRRLPGFGGAWEIKKLKELGSTYGGLTGKTKSDFGEGSSQYITFMNVMNNVVVDDEIFELVNISENESQNRVMMGDLLFNGSSETPEELGFCSVVSKSVKNVYLNSFCFGFRFKEVNKSCGLYFAYFFRSKEGRELLKSLAQGATRYNLSKTSLLNLSFRIPSLDEQIAIADVLSELDAEVLMIQSRLSKAQQIKHAMMQELLTGRIRLI